MLVKIAIVVPAFNEADSIARVVAAISPYGTPIVVDDASADDTGARAASAGAIVVRHVFNLGYDQALATGFDKAVDIDADAIVTIDGDGQLDSAAIGVVLDKLERVPLVLGTRSSDAPRFAETLFNLYTRIRFGVPDVLCGLKGFRMEHYLEHQFRAGSSSVHTAMALALLRGREPFALVPVTVKPRLGASRYGGVWRANVRILRALGGAVWNDLWRR